MSTNSTQIKLLVLITTIILIMLSSCSANLPDYLYIQPEEFDDGLVMGDAEENGIDTDTLGVGIERIRNGNFGAVHSVLIYKDGKLVVEEYFPGHRFSWDHEGYRGEWTNWGPDAPHVNMSVTKSWTSAIVGIAVEEGYISSVHDPIFDYLPDHQRFATDGKEDITIEHLFTMTSGLEWDEWNSKSGGKNSIINLYSCSDQVECVLEVPLLHQPGSHFTYSGGNFVVLGEIIRNTTGLTIDEFAESHLYTPLGIDRLPMWVLFESGIVDTAGGSLHTSREMLKLGITYLNDGEWNGQQVIPEEWIYLSSVPYVNNTGIKVPGADGGRKGYGYSWWTWDTQYNGSTLETFYAGGWGGQRIFVIPDLDTVVVMTYGNYNSDTHTFKIMDKYILAAIHE